MIALKILRFMGYSDDTFGEYAYSNIDYDNCASGKPITFKITAGGKSMYVTGQYSKFGDGVWDIGVSAKEDELPNWEMNLTFDAYTPVLTIYVPHDEISIEHIRKKN